MNRRAKATLHRDEGPRLNKAWGVGAAQSRYSHDGHWYATLASFPAALFDKNGYILFATKKKYQEYQTKRYISVGKEISIRKPGISAIPGYVHMRGSNASPKPDLGIDMLAAAEESRRLGGGFADPETRKEVEAAAIAFATHELKRRGFQVHDHQRKNHGYDLQAVSHSSKLLVEVKGTDSSEPRFFLTRNERRCSSQQEAWRLFTVCKARSTPVLYEYTAAEMHRQFTLDPLAWECQRMDL